MTGTIHHRVKHHPAPVAKTAAKVTVKAEIRCDAPNSPKVIALRQAIAKDFREAGTAGLVPKGYTLNMASGDADTSPHPFAPGGVINVKPGALACMGMGKNEAKAVLLHEIGHTHQHPHLMLAGSFAANALAVIGAMKIALALGRHVRERLGGRYAALNGRKLFGYTGALALGWTANAGLAYQSMWNETRADLYAVHKMGAKKPMLDTLLDIYVSTNGDPGNASRYDVSRGIMRGQLLVTSGPAAFIPLHPLTLRRIVDVLRDPTPTGPK